MHKFLKVLNEKLDAGMRVKNGIRLSQALENIFKGKTFSMTN